MYTFTLTFTGVEISRLVSCESWDLLASIKLLSGADLSIYQPRHPTAYDRTVNPLRIHAGVEACLSEGRGHLL